MQVLEPVKTENIDYHDLAKRVATLVKDSYAKLSDRYDGPETRISLRHWPRPIYIKVR